MYIIYDWITTMGYSKHELGTTNMLYSPIKKIGILHLVCYTAVFSVVTQRSSPQRALCDDTKNGCVADYITPLPRHNGHLSTTATFFCPQGGRCGEVPLYKWKRQKFKEMFVSGSLNPAKRQPISGLLLNIPREDDPHAVSTAGNRRV